jgi:hypothetical protein
MTSHESLSKPQREAMHAVLDRLSVTLDPAERQIQRMKAEVHTAMGWYDHDRTSAFGRIKRSYDAFHEAESAIHRPRKPIHGSPEAVESDRRARQRETEEAEQKYQEARETYQIQLAGFLFQRNKELFRSSKGSLESYDLRKEDKQIEGVLRALSGQHLHMGTGEGKSTTVLPIAALVDAATNGDGRVVVGSANRILVDELQRNTERLADVMEELPMYKNTVELTGLEDSGKKEKKTTEETLMRRINRDYLTSDRLSQKTKKQIKEHYWDADIKSHESDEQDYLEEGNGSIQIYFAEEKKLVFDWMQETEKFENGCPQIFMDEAHVPYDKKTPYSITNSSLAVSERDVREGVVDWVVRRMLVQHIKPDSIISDSGRDVIADESMFNRLASMDFSTITVDGKDELSGQFRDAVDIVLQSLGESPKARTQVQKRILKDLQRMVPPMGEREIPYGLQKTEKELKQMKRELHEAEVEMVLTRRDGGELHKHYQDLVTQLRAEIAFAEDANEHASEPEAQAPHQEYLATRIQDIAEFIKLQGKEYTQTKSGIVIRDAYVDELLEEHEYEENVQATVLAITGKFEPIKRKVAFKTISYPSFLHAVSDNMVAVSGTLLYPDPHKKQMKKGSFAKLLESETGRQVHMLAVPEMKPFPEPRLMRTTDDVYTQLARDLRWERAIDVHAHHTAVRPTLVVDYNGMTSALKTYEEMKKVFGEDRVRLLTAKPTSGENNQLRQLDARIKKLKDEERAEGEAQKKLEKTIELKQAEKERDTLMQQLMQTDPAIRYEQELNTYRRQLANGEIDVLISSGSAALGVNFEKTDGSFPDLRTVELGLPDSEERIAQTTGRRRMTENNTLNHLWYLSLDSLERATNLLQSEKGYMSFDFKKTREQMREALENALTTGDRSKVTQLVYSLMSELRGYRSADEGFQKGFDALMDREIVPAAERFVKRKIALEMLKYRAGEVDLLLDPEFIKGKRDKKPTLEQMVQADLIRRYFNLIGLPANLQSDIITQEVLATMQERKLVTIQYTHEQMPMRLQNIRDYVLKDYSSGFNLDAILTGWYENAKQSTLTFAHVVDMKDTLKKLAVPYDRKKRYAIAVDMNPDISSYLSEIAAQEKALRIMINQYTYVEAMPLRDGTSVPVVTTRLGNQTHRFTFLTPQLNLLSMPVGKSFSFVQSPLSLNIMNQTSVMNVLSNEATDEEKS